MKLGYILFISFFISFSFNSQKQFSQVPVDSLAYYVVPNAYLNAPAGASFLGPLANAQRTYQFLINASELTNLVGKPITGITYRLLPSATSNWPAGDITFTSYDIYLSGSVAPADRSLTFALNVVGTQKKVRSGGLTITAGSFPFGGSPTQFGFNILFDSTYQYNSGHLLIELRHTGTSTAGYGTLYSACWTSSYTGTAGTQGNFAVIRLTAETPVSTGNGNTIVPDKYALNQNYPNPFNPSTTIKFGLPKESDVKIIIYDIYGREVHTLVNGKYNAGEYEITWNASEYASGVYFYKMITNNFYEVRKMTLVK
jgi:hypothetical protein